MSVRAFAVAVLAFSATTFAGADARAQDAAPLVRVRLGDAHFVQGYLRGNSADELVVFTSDRQYRHVPRASVKAVEVRERLGSHARRGAVMGMFLWASLMFAASIDELEDAGPASWQSGALFAGSVGLGALAGKSVPRHGWRETSPASLPGPAIKLSFRF